MSRRRRIGKHQANAIRRGLLAAKKTRYGDEDDPYYEVRSDLTWSFSIGDGDLRELAMKAFDRAWQRISEARVAGLSPEEKRQADQVFRERHARWIETREERQLRLLREEIARTQRALEAHVAECTPAPAPGLEASR